MRDNINTSGAMTSQSQFQTSSSETTSLLNNNHYSGDPEWAQNWVRNGNQNTNRPRQSPRNNENSPLLPPMPQSMPPPPSKAHARSRSEFAFPTQSDPAHPFNRGGQRPPTSGNRNRPKQPSRNSFTVPPHIHAIPVAPMPRKPSSFSHRRAKSDVPLLAFGGGSVTKADLLKNFPNPRWGGGQSSLNTSQYSHRKRTSSDGGLLLMAAAVAADGASISSGYGSTGGQSHPLSGPGTIGSVVLNDAVKRPSTLHKRTRSDASVQSVTTNMAKSALFKGVTAKGTLQLQLPKDDFRVLMDSQLDAGCVYKRKLVDDEDEVFIDYHTVEEGNQLQGSACVCTCAHCQRCHEKAPRLPPALYVMAVDSTLYRRILDEIIDSKSMPCGTYFCGHHEDVRHPDVKIAGAIVIVMFLVLLAGAVVIRD